MLNTWAAFKFSFLIIFVRKTHEPFLEIKLNLDTGTKSFYLCSWTCNYEDNLYSSIFKHFSDFNILTSFNQFWDVVKPLFSNKKLDSDDHILINNQDKIANNDVKLVELFTSYFINAIENTKGKTLTNLGDFSNQ